MKQKHVETEEKITKEELQFLHEDNKKVNFVFWLDFIRTFLLFITSVLMIYIPCFTTAKGKRSMFTNVVDFFLKKPDNFNENLWFYLIYLVLVLLQFFIIAYSVYQLVTHCFSIKDKSAFFHQFVEKDDIKLSIENISYISIVCFLAYLLFHILLKEKTVKNPINLLIIIPSIFAVITIILNIYLHISKNKIQKGITEYKKKNKNTEK